jgi:NAD(P)H-quinone oxidoreductase subunit 2
MPEIVLTIAIVFAALWNLLFPKLKEATWFWAVGGLIAPMFLFRPLPATDSKTAILFNGLFSYDALTIAFGVISLLVGLLVVLMTIGYEHQLGRNRGEFYAILMTAVLSVMLLAGTTDLIMLFVSLETLSICCVLLAGFSKRDIKSGEASLKYLLSTAAVTATLMYGLSFVYGLSESTSYATIADKMAMLSVGSPSLIRLFIAVLILSAVGFKLSTVPFHMWTPDVYEGAPTPVTAFLSIGSKAGGFVIALRLLTVVFAKSATDWIVLLSVLAVLSMILGNLTALAQSSFKRMLAYSSIAHIGYMVIGLIAGPQFGYSSVVFYIIVYGLMNLGAFAGAILVTNEIGSDRIDDLSGLIRKRPILALGMTLCLLNLAGLPLPPAGFFAKIFIFQAGLQIAPVANINLGWILVAVALLTSIPAIYYYTRVCVKMIVREPSDAVQAMPAERPFFDSPQSMPILALSICVAFISYAGTWGADQLMTLSHMAVAPLALQAQQNNGQESTPLHMGYVPDKRSAIQ